MNTRDWRKLTFGKSSPIGFCLLFYPLHLQEKCHPTNLKIGGFSPSTENIDESLRDNHRHRRHRHRHPSDRKMNTLICHDHPSTCLACLAISHHMTYIGSSLKLNQTNPLVVGMPIWFTCHYYHSKNKIGSLIMHSFLCWTLSVDALFHLNRINTTSMLGNISRWGLLQAPPTPHALLDAHLPSVAPAALDAACCLGQGYNKISGWLLLL